MLAQDLVSDNFASVAVTDSLEKVDALMDEYKVAHLPVIDQNVYQGLIAERFVRNADDPIQLLKSQLNNLLVLSVTENQHIYEVIDIVARFELTLLPVVSQEKVLKGCITLPDLIRNFNLLTAAGQPGAILVIKMVMQDYSPTLISRIIEDNQAKIISLYVISDPVSQDLTLTVKINTQETSSIVRSLDRFGYTVQTFSLSDSQLDDFYRSRYEELMKYMNI